MPVTATLSVGEKMKHWSSLLVWVACLLLASAKLAQATAITGFSWFVGFNFSPLTVIESEIKTSHSSFGGPGFSYQAGDLFMESSAATNRGLTGGQASVTKFVAFENQTDKPFDNAPFGLLEILGAFKPVILTDLSDGGYAKAFTSIELTVWFYDSDGVFLRGDQASSDLNFSCDNYTCGYPGSEDDYRLLAYLPEGGLPVGGRVVTTVFISSGVEAFAPVPAPTTVALLLVGLAAIALRRRESQGNRIQ